MRYCKILTCCVGFVLLSWNIQAQDIPKWVKQHIEHMTKEGGSWLTDNSKYMSENEAFVAYGMYWEKNLGPAGMKGKLFGVDTLKNEHVFWEFYYYWHPSDQQFKTLQYGTGGALIEGRVESTGDGQTKALETFHTPGGQQSFQIGHKAVEKPGEFVTESFDIRDSSWIPKRKYTWKRQKSE